MSSRSSDPDDPSSGLAVERTELAWNRTALAVAVCCAAMGRRMWPFDSAGRLLALGALAVGIGAWITVLAVAGRRRGAQSDDRGRQLWRITVATLAFAVTGLTVGFLAAD